MNRVARLTMSASLLTLAVAIVAPAAAIATPVWQVSSQVNASQDTTAGQQVQSSDPQVLERAAENEGTPQEDIVVTGTLLRGAAPVGSNLITVGSDRIQSQGATSSNELLATVPQVSNLFNTVPSANLAGAPSAIQVVRPNLRNLTPGNGSSNSTLVLIDGHRLVGVGVTQAAVDPDVIPTAAIERVEVVTDGGSATYGADAVGGVINFVTRKRFDGIRVDARYGFADNYHTTDANAIVGKDWGSGSLFGSYSFQKNDALFGRDRDFIRQVDYNTSNLTPIGRQCSPGNVTLPGAFSFQTFTFGPSTTYGLPNLTTPGFNACDLSDDTTFVPSIERHSAIVGLHQELSESIEVDLRAFYGQRSSTSYAPLRGVATVAPGSAFYRPAAANPTGVQQVEFTLAPVLGRDSAPSGTKFQEWGANAEVRAKLFGDFQLRTLLNYSRSNSTYYNVQLNQTLLLAAGSASSAQAAVNFYDPAATPNRAVIDALANSELAGQGKSELFNVRSIIDGTLFTLPGGAVRVAAGYEFLGDRFQQRIAPVDAVRGAVRSVAYTPYNRDTHAAFGELQVPIFGEGNRVGGIYSLVVNGSVRYDHFSDFGGTTNPKVGVTYKPVSWLGLRGNYSTSFNAPSAVDQLGSLRNTITFFPFNAFVRPGDTPGVTGTVALQGSVPTLQPQTAKTYSFGFDIDPPFLSGLNISLNYYNVKFDNLISIPTPSAEIFSSFPNNVISNVNGVTTAQLQAFGLLAPNGTSVVNQLIAAGRPIYELVDFRTGNYGSIDTDGLDFAASYRQQTGFGGIDASVSGNYVLNRTRQVGPGAPVVDDLDFDVTRLSLQGILGTDIGGFRAQATVNFSQGYPVERSVALPQDRLGDFTTVNLFFKYDFRGEGALKDLTLTANINNIFDTDPPLYKLSTGNGFTSFFTLGRLIQVGLSKKF